MYTMKNLKSVIFVPIVTVIIIAVYLVVTHYILTLDYTNRFPAEMIWLVIGAVLPSSVFAWNRIKTWFGNGKLNLSWANLISFMVCLVLLLLFWIHPLPQFIPIHVEYLLIIALFFWYHLFSSFYKEA